MNSHTPGEEDNTGHHKSRIPTPSAKPTQTVTPVQHRPHPNTDTDHNVTGVATLTRKRDLDVGIPLRFACGLPGQQICGKLKKKPSD